MKNHQTRTNFLARIAMAASAGIGALLRNLTGRRSAPRRMLAPPPRWTQHANAETMMRLGLLHLKGRGATSDYGQARQWFQKAAAAGSATAMYNLGVMHEHGHGVAKDYAQARGWYEKAVAAGNAPAAERLSHLP